MAVINRKSKCQGKSIAPSSLRNPSPLQSLSLAALALPGLMLSAAYAEEDIVDFQYSHYQEGRREGIYKYYTSVSGAQGKIPVPDKRNPIEVDSLHGSSRITLTDRVKFAFNYTEDTWSGATPLASAPEQSGANRTKGDQTPDGVPIVTTGASPYAGSGTLLDSHGNAVVTGYNPTTNKVSKINDRTVHVMSYASPETRKQGDFKLGYEWDEAALDLGGGISTERDYESRFVNLGGRKDFNQKQTTVNLGLSYTNSAVDAVLNPVGYGFFQTGPQYNDSTHYNPSTKLWSLRGNREDWATHLGLTQVLNQNVLMELGMGYTRSTGFMENPYKLSWMFGVDPKVLAHQQVSGGLVQSIGRPFVEQRPDLRNQFNWNARFVQYVEPLDAALHLDYQFAHDDWAINAHTFSADWVQPVGAGWTLTPQIRYYSQDAANFYKPFFVTSRTKDPVTRAEHYDLPQYFSSDQRLSGYGALSGGLIASKQFAKGIRLETGIEYYTHQSRLKLGGGGEQSFADFDYWVANAALKVNLSALGQGGSGGDYHTGHIDHANVPAGVLFGHTLKKSGDMMVGYRYMRNQQAGGLLHGTQTASEQQSGTNACPGTDGCALLPHNMNMNMHMLDLMIAPTDWLTLMLMPQFVDMDMALYQPTNAPAQEMNHGHGGAHGHATGGIGDTGLYAMVKLFEVPHHHLHVTAGLSAPTGDAGIHLKETEKNLEGGFVHYGMQLGSGTWDFKPSLTYTGKADDWSWGVQVAGTKRLEASNASGYALGDLFETSAWGGYDLTHWISASVRAIYSWQGSIKGAYTRSNRNDAALFQCNKANYTYQDEFDPDTGEPTGPFVFHQKDYNDCLANLAKTKRQLYAQDHPSPMDAPRNYGGQYVDMGFGLSATVPRGSLAGNRLSFEWLQPVYTDVNGYQLNRDGALSFTWGVVF